MFVFDLINILLVITVLIYLLFAFFIFRKSKNRNNSNAYLVEIGAIILWTLAMIFYRSSPPEYALIWCRLLYAFATFTASGFLLFSIVFPYEETVRIRTFLLVLLLNVAVIFLVLHPSYVIKDVISPPSGEKIIIWGNLYFLYFLFISGFATSALFILFKKFRAAAGIAKLQIKYVFWGYLWASGLAMVTNLAMPWMGYFFQNWIGQIFTIAMVAFTAYAIVRFRLLGIRTIVSKIYIYFLIAVFAYSFFYFSVLIEELLFGSLYSMSALAFAPVMAFSFSILFLPTFKKIQKSSDVLFFSGYNPKKIIKDLAIKLSSVINLDELLVTLAEEFKRILATESIDVFVFDKNDRKQNTCISILRNKSKSLPIGGAICSSVLVLKKILVYEELSSRDNADLRLEMDRIKAQVVAPLISRQKVIGLIILGEKIEQESYSKEDIDFLEIISSQAAVAIENARLYKEVEDFNRTLQQKVDVQTKEIREKAEHLRKLMDMRSEFLDITSHQLRTPVTVIKGVLSMLEEGSIPPAKRKEFLRGAFEKSIKLGEIINDILRASEMDSERFELNLRPTDLNEILKKIQEDKLRTSQRKNITLKFRLPKKPLPPIMSDEKYIEQAIVNLINNSFQYTPKGSIAVSAEVLPKSVVIRVADTGIGIPKEDIPKLYSKFARAENAVQTYTDGSGLGLFIIRQIVDATPGAKIEIEKTEVGKGTTFALTLPIVKPS